VSCCLSDCHCTSLLIYLALLKHVNDLIAGGSEGSGRKATDWPCFANLWDANGPAFASTIVLHICGPPRRVPGNMPSSYFCCILHSHFWRGSFQICHLPSCCYLELVTQNVFTSSHEFVDLACAQSPLLQSAFQYHPARSHTFLPILQLAVAQLGVSLANATGHYVLVRIIMAVQVTCAYHHSGILPSMILPRRTIIQLPSSDPPLDSLSRPL
jgi:hypothetical protein